MDAVRNPYSPGAGNPPPELAGRKDVLEIASTAVLRTAAGRPTQSLILVGLRGVGKTVLLNRIEQLASEHDFLTIFIEAHEGKGLPALLIPGLRSALYKLSVVDKAKEAARKGLRVLKSFLGGLKITIEGVDVGRRPDRLTVALRFREDQETEIGPKEADEEHDLAGDEQGHAITQAKADDG